jgi:hypothetical protein
MINRYSWKNYNHNINKIIRYNVTQNNLSTFNVIEKSYYPHTRDIFALTASSKNIINILDYGSNLSLLSNLKNKINLDKKKFYIYDPFNSHKKKINIKNVKYEIKTNFNDLIKINYDLIHFGSCIQYIENPLFVLKCLKHTKNLKILITATPFNYKMTYSTEQTNHNNLKQIVHNYEMIIKFFSINGFDLIFKSSMDIKLAKLKVLKSKTYFLNLLFQKK